MSKVRHILGISGGKDSAALSIYLKQKYPQLNVEYYLDKDGNVAKRTKKELEKRLKKETDKDIKEYIQYL